MPWCPKCKNEYVEGIEFCADCGSKLTATLEEVKEQEAVSASGLQGLTADGSQDPGAEALQEQRSLYDEQAGDRAVKSAGVYQKSSQKAEEFKSSAYVLIAMGILGFAGLVVLDLGFLPLQLGIFQKYLINGVMGAMFLLFFVMGILSMRSSRRLSAKAETEDELTKEILSWCQEKLTAECIDEGLFDGEEADLSAELKYFKRTARMQERIGEQFLNLDEAYLEQLVDDYYQEVFGA